MRAVRGRSTHAPRRLIGVVALCVLIAASAPTTRAQVSRDDVAAARARVQRLEAEIRSLHARLDALSAESDRIATRLYEAEIRLEQTQRRLVQTRTRLQQARDRYLALRGRLEDRAREAFMLGPGSSIEFLLGATSLTDLSDRIEFVGAVAQTDVDLAVQVDNLRNELLADQRELERLRARQAEIVLDLEAQQAALEDKLAEQQALLDRIEEKKAEARREAQALAERWQEQLEAQLASYGGGGALPPAADGIFRYCPVGQPRAVSNSFGAPRVGHLHAGVDIFAPYDTPIYAPFDGTARASTNGLGGYAVYVYGAHGYVYNAHLSRPGHSGPVQAGDVIGYVGTSGNAQGTSPHNHFEWHPNQIPEDWPASPYGYAVLGDAVNPYPLLAPIC